MYQQFYGLAERPFSLLPDPDFLYLSANHRTALDMLELSICNQSGFCVISGEIGAGKTTLVRELLNRVDRRVTVGLVSNTHPSFGELLQWVAAAFGLSLDTTDKLELHKRFIDFVIAQYAQNKHTLLIVDEAQNLSVDALEELRMLSNVNSDKDFVLQIMLVGQPQLRDKLRDPALRQFAQRIALDYHLDTLDAQETAAYIRHRLRHAGGDPKLFSDDACLAVAHHTQGTPRLINRLCDLALVYGFSEKRTQIDAALVEQVASDGYLGAMAGSNVPAHRDLPATPAAQAGLPQANDRAGPRRLAPEPLEKTRHAVPEAAPQQSERTVRPEPEVSAGLAQFTARKNPEVKRQPAEQPTPAEPEVEPQQIQETARAKPAEQPARAEPGPIPKQAEETARTKPKVKPQPVEQTSQPETVPLPAEETKQQEAHVVPDRAAEAAVRDTSAVGETRRQAGAYARDERQLIRIQKKQKSSRVRHAPAVDLHRLVVESLREEQLIRRRNKKSGRAVARAVTIMLVAAVLTGGWMTRERWLEPLNAGVQQVVSALQEAWGGLVEGGLHERAGSPPDGDVQAAVPRAPRTQVVPVQIVPRKPRPENNARE